MEIELLSDAIIKELQDYSEEIDEKMQNVIEDVTNEALEDLKNNSKVPKRTPEYAKKFYKKNLAQGTGYKRNVIANKKYQITHLLEYGHATRNGGRTKAFPHWQQAQEIVDKLPKKLKAVIEK